ncbi:MAG: 50S ribosomal protein L25/general stress protein Ctc [Legionellales bacterium]|nr:50S ribosomal protein L25/general stress protein Ctc [Legionellales bacterium]
MAKAFEFHATSRQDVGKGASRRLRRLNNLVPAIIYGGTENPHNITLEHNKVVKALESEAVYSSILHLHVDGKAEKVVLKALQRHPSEPRILHMDFQRISATEKISMQVPLHFTGEDVAPGVKQGGGIVSHMLSSADVICLATDLPEYIEVDISNLELDRILHLSDLTLPKGVEFIALNQGNDLPVVTIHKPRAEKAESTDAAAAPSDPNA